MVVQHRPSASRPQHAVLRVQGTWDDYLESRGKNYVQSGKKSERRLARAGRSSVSSGRVESQAIVDKIMEVDRNSWKQEWRRRRGASDDDSVGILDYHRYAPASKFCPLYWLLELDGKPIAFCLATILGEVAYLSKTSYDVRHKYLEPGIVINTRMFHDLFESGSVSRMDFFTWYDYMRRWTSEMLSRETFMIENHRGPFKLLMRIRRSEYAAKVWRASQRLGIWTLFPILQGAHMVRDYYDVRKFLRDGIGQEVSVEDFDTYELRHLVSSPQPLVVLG